ncbi:MAG TPA: tetratricopeptide repeat protein, partial [Ktedonobacterales bacterium]
MFRAVARFCANVGGQRGALLLLDDLQWAGRDALDLIVSLVHAAGDIRLRLILAYRSTELAPDTAIHDALANLAHARLARPLPLEPLTPLEAGELLCDLLGTSATHDRAEDRRAEVVLRRAGGVPFFLVSCAQREVERQAGDDRLEAVPWDVARSIEQRVAALPPEARALLGAAAMAGRRVARPLLLALGGRLGQRPEESLSALDILHQARLLVAAEPEAFQFTHDLIREAVEAELGPGQRIALHRWIAQTLEAATGEPAAALLAFHWQGGAMPERAVIYLERAGAHADALHAHAEAADAYQALVRVLDGLDRPIEAAAARIKLGQTWLASAQYDEALAALRQAATSYDAAGEFEGLARASALQGEVYVLRATPDEGVRQLEALLALPCMRAVSLRGLAALHVTLAWLINATGRYEAALAPAERAAELATAEGDEILLTQAELRRGQLLLMLGRLEEGARVLEGALPLAERAGDLRSLRLALNSIGWVHETWGDFARDQGYTERAFAVAERLGDPTVSAFMWSNRGGPAFNLGDWPEARNCFEQGLALMRQQGPSWASAWPPLLLGQLELAQGHAGMATDLLDEAIGLAERSGDLQALRQAQCALAERELLAGRPAAALAQLAPLGDRASQPESDVRTVLPLLAWAKLELGQVAEAIAIAERAVERARAARMRPALAEALRVRALIAARQGDLEAACDMLEQALALSREVRSPYAEAKVRLA